jgi:hypothetical protein
MKLPPPSLPVCPQLRQPCAEDLSRSRSAVTVRTVRMVPVREPLPLRWFVGIFFCGVFVGWLIWNAVSVVLEPADVPIGQGARGSDG